MVIRPKGLGLGLGLQARSGAANGPAPFSGTVIFTLIGQSNMVGRAPYDSGDLWPAGTLQWHPVGGRPIEGSSAAGEAIAAAIPLDHWDEGNTSMGPDIAFCQSFAAANPEADIVLVPAADGATSFQGNHWNPGDSRYTEAVTRTNEALAAFPDALFGGFLWHQGENDTGTAAQVSAYEAALDAMITQMRAEVTAAGPTTPFVLGRMVPNKITQNTETIALDAIVADTPARLAYTAVADSTGLTDRGDNLHFDAASQRVLGARYYLAFDLARANRGQGGPVGQTPPLATGTVPDQVDLRNLTAPAALGSIPAQTDTLALTPPLAVGTIPDQEDLAA